MLFELDSENTVFPHPRYADEDGLLAVGGNLTPERLLTGYRYGIFPWYSENSPILWYAPHERFVLHPHKVKVSKSMQKTIHQKLFTITRNRCFEDVIRACAAIPRKDQDGTWIVEDIIAAYSQLHQMGFAHSVEVWREDSLVGGLYGILVGKVFCGESMFSRVSNASKTALIYLCQNFDLTLIDCQIDSRHLESLGAEIMPQLDFLD
ncbi:MAG TPA: leucyl/phenylalanyl-tRNA--protein transferase, partial [Sphingobacterium sp.]|nr:leucyl/phenylalanyl-tRNA--protein transferase [Sphingobacterium sp.]